MVQEEILLLIYGHPVIVKIKSGLDTAKQSEHFLTF